VPFPNAASSLSQHQEQQRSDWYQQGARGMGCKHPWEKGPGKGWCWEHSDQKLIKMLIHLSAASPGTQAGKKKDRLLRSVD